jgi:hypothetical protein
MQIPDRHAALARLGLRPANAATAPAEALHHRIPTDLRTGRTPPWTPCRRLNRDADGRTLWDGIQMAGPYSWRPPSYWFSNQYAAARGSSAEQGDNEHIPPYASLRRFIPPDSSGRSTTPGSSTPGRLRRTRSWSTCDGSSIGG